MDYMYRARVIRVIDADTLHLEVDLGLDVHVFITARLNGINAPEKRTPEGVAAMRWLIHRLGGPSAHILWYRIRTIKDRKEKFGRYLIDIWPFDEHDKTVSEIMIDQGYAVPYKP